MKGELLTIKAIEERLNFAIKSRNETEVNYWMGYRARAMEEKFHHESFRPVCGADQNRTGDSGISPCRRRRHE